MGLLDLLYPKLCLGCGRVGSYLCDGCVANIKVYSQGFCPVCARAAVNSATHPVCTSPWSLDGVVCFFYYDSLVKKIIHTIKYRLSRDVAEVFQPLFAKAKLPVNLNDFVLVPIPLHTQRQNWRGFNQAKILGENLARQFKLTLEEGLLSRKKLGRPQVELKLAARKENLQGAFEVEDKNKVSGRKILLFDDVWTTGATMREAGKVLKRAGATEVWALCLATSHMTN